MGISPLTAIAEATQFPKNWDMYWTLRTHPNEFSIYQACKAMCEAQYEGWDKDYYKYPAHLQELRWLEVLTNAIECCEPAPCKCPRCL